MFRTYKFENIFGDFNNAAYADESGKVVTPISRDATQHYVDIADGFGKWHRYRVDYTIGADSSRPTPPVCRTAKFRSSRSSTTASKSSG